MDNPSFCADVVPARIDPASPMFWVAGLAGLLETVDSRGGSWASAFHGSTGVMSILPPNRELCGYQGPEHSGVYPPSSAHQGGVHMLMGDGAVKYITDSIEAGNSRAPMVRNGGTGPTANGQRSPYGLWGALGTRATKEPLPGDF